jgi:hypothetical protein
MHERSFSPDLTGSNESLDDLLSRLKFQLSRVKARPGRDLPPDEDHFYTGRWPKGGCSAAEAPLPKADKSLADCYAS